jgi:pimeloyl-ACP methyl ester carboxylesterase
MRIDVVLLPGLHGSTSLFDTFVALAPPWARCRPIALPLAGSQHFDALADVIEPRLRPLEGFVLFAESFSGPLAARLATRLGRKVSLLVLCNPLVESPVALAPSVLSSIVRSPMLPTWAVSFAMTGGDRRLAAAVLREVRALPVHVLVERLAAAAAAGREDFLRYLAAPALAIIGTRDRLLSPRMIEDLFDNVPFGVVRHVEGPHLAAQAAPAAVWAAITGEFERAA